MEIRSRGGFRFGTKAETLQALQANDPDLYWIPPLLFFTRHEWDAQPDRWLCAIQERFGDRSLAIRSSALQEDGAQHSGAGENDSCLSVTTEQRAKAVDQVFASYRSPHGLDQVLVQEMVVDIAVSGVITTYVLDDGAPYLTLSYDDESGKPDAITGGVGVHKTVLVHRDTPDWMMDSPRLRRWVNLARRLEEICCCAALDIEFAETHTGKLCLLQVRRITTTARWSGGLESSVRNILTNLTVFLRQRSCPKSGLLGSRTLLGEMPDWNPAEIIGTNPRVLASSLYRWLITDSTWAEARARMGYRRVDQRLMVTLAGRPFIDVRCSFNSFLPADLEASIGSRLVDGWLARLEKSPELHDKVEFDVALTAYDFAFDEKMDGYPDLLDDADRQRFREALCQLTRRALSGNSLEWACDQALKFAAEPPIPDESDDLLARVEEMLTETRLYGTLPFAIAARHAFIAENLLRSAVRRQALAPHRLAQFKRSLPTITRVLSGHWTDVCNQRLSRDEFLKLYGHLRPGTYDVLSLRYDQRPELFAGAAQFAEAAENDEFVPQAAESEALQTLLEEAGLGIDAAQLLSYCQRAIAAREGLKFHFTRHLSNALELLLRWAERQGLGREELSHLSIFQLLNLRDCPIVERPLAVLRGWAERGAEEQNLTKALRIGYLLRNERDLYVAPMHRAAPNFITALRVEAPVTVIDAQTPFDHPVVDSIVCIENADPGFDWLFTRGIRGLVTCYGGANSHMGVRSAELGLPAALGCGEQLFQSLCRAGRIVLNCSAQSVRPVADL